MELEILRKLEEEKQALSKAVEEMSERSRWERIRKTQNRELVNGFDMAVSLVKEMVEKHQAQMARDYGMEA